MHTNVETFRSVTSGPKLVFVRPQVPSFIRTMTQDCETGGCRTAVVTSEARSQLICEGALMVRKVKLKMTTNGGRPVTAGAGREDPQFGRGGEGPSVALGKMWQERERGG